MPVKIADAPGVEGFHAVRAGVILQYPADGLCQGVCIAVSGFEFNDQRGLPVKQVQHLLECGNRLVRAAQMIVFQVLGSQVFHEALPAGGPLQVGIVHDGQRAVLQQMDIEFNAIALVQSSLVGGQAVFRLLVIVEAPVGIEPAPKGLHAGLIFPAPETEQVQNHENDD